MFGQAETCPCQQAALEPLQSSMQPQDSGGPTSKCCSMWAELCPCQQTALQQAQPDFKSEGHTTGPP